MHATATLEARAAAAAPCPHTPPCPAADAPDAQAAHVAVAHYDQGWSLLCNGLVSYTHLDHAPLITPTTGNETERTAR